MITNPVTRGLQAVDSKEKLARRLGLKSTRTFSFWETKRQLTGRAVGRVPERYLVVWCQETGMTPAETRPDLAKLFNGS